VGDALAAVPEIVEAFSITGGGDLLTPVVARDDAHLEDVIQKLISLPGVVRTRTEVALHEPSRTDCCTWWSRSGAQPADDLGHPGAVSGLSRADGDKVASTAWAASYAR
jgi:DNA-binding Lrp family transcriptional regulator